MPKLTKILISNDVPTKISFTRKSALRLTISPCTFQNLAGTLQQSHYEIASLQLKYKVTIVNKPGEWSNFPTSRSRIGLDSGSNSKLIYHYD